LNKATISIDWEDFGQLTCRDKCNIITKPSEDVYRQTDIILDLLNRTNTKATFFILGMLARNAKDLLRKVAAQGHEIALHGDMHEPLFSLSRDQVFVDIENSLKLVQDVLGMQVYGYRAPYFSIIQENLYVLEVLAELGLEYDSSIFPMKLPRYGIENFSKDNQLYQLKNGSEIVILPPSIVNVFNKTIPVAGGGYMRLLPLSALKRLYKKLAMNDTNGAMIYMHPYEFDNKSISVSSNYPKDLEYSKLNTFFKDFKWNLLRKSIVPKLEYLFNTYEFITCKEKSDYVRNNTKRPAVLG